MRIWRSLKRWRKKIPTWLEFSVLGAAAAFFLFIGAVMIWAAVMPLPAINNFQNRAVALSTKIYDRTGNIVLYDVHGAMRRTAVPLDQISIHTRNATIAVEDDTFYKNLGFRPLAFARAVWIDITTGSYRQGGSTITQQVVKNALLTPNKTIARKLQEIVLALRLTRTYSKDDILNTYLNETPYGGTIYGVQEASQYFFGIDAKDADLAQAAYLAAIPQAPTYYSPYGNHRKELEERKNFVLSRMLKTGSITQEEYEQAKAEEVEFKKEQEAGIKAPHFVFYVREYLERKYGADVVANGGLRVVTTLDYDMQEKAEKSVSDFGPGMQRNFNASNEGVVVLDPKTGQILAMVGSRDYFNDDIDGQVNVTIAPRQPGSSFKPFVYATAFEKGYTPDTVVFDLPTQFSTACAPTDNLNDTPPCYSPSNYDGAFKGPMKLRDALAQSQNVPAVKTLYLAGIKDSIQTARDLGISTLESAGRYGLTLVLGGGEVNLLEMTGAYAVFANDGVRNPPTGILRVEDARGAVLESYESQPTQAIDPQIARQINDILSDNVARTPEFGADSPLNFPGFDVADKTGTTNDFHDVWILGYTPSVAVGAWAGNNDNEAMAKKIAAFIIAPLWHDIMEKAIEKYSSATDAFPAPAPAPGNLPAVLSGEWNTDPTRGIHSILYWIDKDNPREPRATSPQSDPQFLAWEYAVQVWTFQHPELTAGAALFPGTVPIAPGSGGPGAALSITSPQPGTVMPFGVPVTIAASVSDPSRVRDIAYYVNGAPAGVSGQPPYAVAFTPGMHGVMVLRAVAAFLDGSSAEVQTTFTVR